jgi:hypothetical protein
MQVLSLVMVGPARRLRLSRWKPSPAPWCGGEPKPAYGLQQRPDRGDYGEAERWRAPTSSTKSSGIGTDRRIVHVEAAEPLAPINPSLAVRLFRPREAVAAGERLRIESEMPNLPSSSSSARRRQQLGPAVYAAASSLQGAVH